MKLVSSAVRMRPVLLAAIGVALFTSMQVDATAAAFVQRNLVSDIPGLAAFTDPALKNPWGRSFGPTSPFWISDQGSNVATLYTNAGGSITKLPLVVSIPTTASGPQGPTGQVFNSTGAFALPGSTSARFIFADLNGTISAWNSGTAAQVVVPSSPGTVYTGLAVNTDPSLGPLLYAADTAGGTIDVFDGAFQPVTLPSGAFVDPDPAVSGLVPFNVQSIDGNVYVTYAPPGRPAQIAAPRGEGAVAVFDTAGNFIRTVVSDGVLASPWGLALAPAGFGAFGGDLLVGNFSFVASEINAFDAATGAFRGTIPVHDGGFGAGGLWALSFGNGTSGDANTLYFNDGINGERNGLFASIAAVPEPGTLTLVALGALLVRLRTRRPQPRRAAGGLPQIVSVSTATP
jgi:uncharacterized protein (TIGR03118 family)